MIVYYRDVYRHAPHFKFVVCSSEIAKIHNRHGIFVACPSGHMNLESYAGIYTLSYKTYFKEDVDNNYHPELLKITKWEF